jgi:hypothetical protein
MILLCSRVACKGMNWNMLLLIVYPKLSVIISCRLQHLCLLQLENYAKTEEAKVEELIKAVADSGAKVIVNGGAVGDMALHLCERYKSVFFLYDLDGSLFFCTFFFYHIRPSHFKSFYGKGYSTLLMPTHHVVDPATY